MASLDAAAADVLLDQLGPEQAELVRQAAADGRDRGRGAAAGDRRVLPHRTDDPQGVSRRHRIDRHEASPLGRGRRSVWPDYARDCSTRAGRSLPSRVRAVRLPAGGGGGQPGPVAGRRTPGDHRLGALPSSARAGRRSPGPAGPRAADRSRPPAGRLGGRRSPDGARGRAGAGVAAVAAVRPASAAAPPGRNRPPRSWPPATGRSAGGFSTTSPPRTSRWPSGWAAGRSASRTWSGATMRRCGRRLRPPGRKWSRPRCWGPRRPSWPGC